MNTNKRKGLHYESLARDYLQKQGLIFLQQNFHSRFGEIDLIMRDADTVCFIEVKYRSRTDFGGAAGSITSMKQQKIIKTAQVFMQESRKHKGLGMRIDAVFLQQCGENIAIDWIPNAFDTDGFS